MKIWEIPIYGTYGEECVSVSASNANDACNNAWEKLNNGEKLDIEYIDLWGECLDWNYTIHKYPNEVLNIRDMDLFYFPPTGGLDYEEVA